MLAALAVEIDVNVNDNDKDSNVTSRVANKVVGRFMADLLFSVLVLAASAWVYSQQLQRLPFLSMSGVVALSNFIVGFMWLTPFSINRQPGEKL